LIEEISRDKIILESQSTGSNDWSHVLFPLAGDFISQASLVDSTGIFHD
jgi:hypothetical protein